MKTTVRRLTIACAITVLTCWASQVNALNCGSVKVVMMNLSPNPVYVTQANGSKLVWNSGAGSEAISDVMPYYVQCKLDVVVNGQLKSGLVPENTTPSTEVHIRVNPDGSVVSNGIDLALNDRIAQYGLKVALGIDQS